MKTTLSREHRRILDEIYERCVDDHVDSSLGSGSRSTALNGQAIFFIRTVKGQLLAKDQLYPTGVGGGGALVAVDGVRLKA